MIILTKENKFDHNKFYILVSIRIRNSYEIILKLYIKIIKTKSIL